MKKTNLKLRRALLGAMGIVALAGVSTRASAVTSITFNGAASSGFVGGPQSWNGNNNGYAGWAMTSEWFNVLVPAAGLVDIKVTGSVSGVQPGFTVWSTGASANVSAPSSHTYNQIGNTSWLAGTFVGFANNYSGDAHWGQGPSNAALGGLAGVAGATVSTGTDGNGNQFAELIFNNASANTWYVLAVGGSGGTTGAYTVTVGTAPVPIPAAVWLFGSALGGLGLFGRRKEAGQSA